MIKDIDEKKINRNYENNIDMMAKQIQTMM